MVAVHASFGDVELAQMTLRGEQHRLLAVCASPGLLRMAFGEEALTSPRPACSAEALRNGLDYEKAVEDPANVTMVTSPQVGKQPLWVLPGHGCGQRALCRLVWATRVNSCPCARLQITIQLRRFAQQVSC
jgi:hypothetical protein